MKGLAAPPEAGRTPGTQPQAELERDLAAKAPPTAHKVVAVDFDNTIFPWGPLMGLGMPFPGAVKAMRLLHEKGYRIVIFTSRASRRWHEREFARFGYSDIGSFAAANLGYVRQKLKESGIPFDEITADKLPAEAYFDDKAVLVEPGTILPVIEGWIKSREGTE